MVGLDSIEYWGGHGISHLVHGHVRTAPEAEKFVPAIIHVQKMVEDWDAEGGILVEPKGTSVAIHYRLSTHPQRTREWLYGRLAPLARTNGLDLLEGRMVFELRPPGLGKGWCIQRIIHERGLAGVVYLGDDQTDVEAFSAVDSWRTAGPDRIGVSVAVENPEAPTRIPLSADHTVKGVTAVERLLRRLADKLGGPGAG
jgi:trehalose 6-phosphate phosphatase